jgi:hypothetical protein
MVLPIKLMVHTSKTFYKLGYAAEKPANTYKPIALSDSVAQDSTKLKANRISTTPSPFSICFLRRGTQCPWFTHSS